MILFFGLSDDLRFQLVWAFWRAKELRIAGSFFQTLKIDTCKKFVIDWHPAEIVFDLEGEKKAALETEWGIHNKRKIRKKSFRETV